MAFIIARMLLSRLLTDAVKDKAIAELRKAAADSENKIDDYAVEVFEAAWPIITGTILKR